MEEQPRWTVTILSRGPNHVIVSKPPSVICHHTSWVGTRRKKLKEGEAPEVPMLQRVRDAIHAIDNDHNQGEEKNDGIMRRVNLVHRLDRGASGALLFAFADEKIEHHDQDEDMGIIKQQLEGTKLEAATRKYSDKKYEKGATAALQKEMSKPTSTKTYVALVRGEGILRGEDLKQKGWFEVNRPIKDEKGRLNDATTSFCFVAGQMTDDADEDSIIKQPRLSLVLARPCHGRWHQIRRHLHGLCHPILGDGNHGCSKTNKEWRQKRNLPSARVFLHLARIQISPTEFTPDIDCKCPLPHDMLQLLKDYAPNVLRDATPILEKVGIEINHDTESTFETYTTPLTSKDD